jgi:cysteinyl-tRNA synthetase, unknown class
MVRLCGVAGLAMLAALGLVVYVLHRMPSPSEALPARQGPALAEVRSWGYQLQHARPDAIPPSFDLLVIDYSMDGSEIKALSPSQVEAFRRRPGDRSRIVLAYLSIGEAENYRYYWWRSWQITAPPWLGRENVDWKGNFPVRYWLPGWRRIIVNSQRSLWERLGEAIVPTRKPYLDRILEAGFDGVYLDRVDAFVEWIKEHPTARQEMAEFVAEISAYAKARKPGFLVVPQNGEELLSRAEYRRVIDGIAKEDLLFGAEREEQENPARDVANSIALLNRAKAANIPVLVVEYVKDSAKRSFAQTRMSELGFVLHFATRGLDVPPKTMSNPSSSAPSSAELPATATSSPNASIRLKRRSEP